jgi:hypothetical protein
MLEAGKMKSKILMFLTAICIFGTIMGIWFIASFAQASDSFYYKFFIGFMMVTLCFSNGFLFGIFMDASGKNWRKSLRMEKTN